TFLGQGTVTINTPVAASGNGIDLVGASYVTIQQFQIFQMPKAGIAVSNASGDVLRSNYIRWSGTSAFYLHGTTQAVGMPVVTGALTEGNTLDNNGTGPGGTIAGDGVQNTRIQNNEFYGDNNAAGIALYQADASGRSTGNVIVNNTVVMPGQYSRGLSLQNASTGNAVFNNIFYVASSLGVSLNISADSRAGLASDYNALMPLAATPDGVTAQTLAQWQSSSGQASHSLAMTSAAIFANLSVGDDRLAPGGPGMDAGTASLGAQAAPGTDNISFPRPSGPRPDLGAYEL